jgi:hypothetical protein
MALVDTLAEQRILETEIERTKPVIPTECEGLHFLLFTPFRYVSSYPKGSRFRTAGASAGVFYASENVETSVSEIVFYRLLFFAESYGTPFPRHSVEFTGFRVAIRSEAALDVTEPPLVADAASWTDPVDYRACQSLAALFRSRGGQLIRYQSVRDPHRGMNVAVLTCRAFASAQPDATQTWRVQFVSAGVRVICESPHQRRNFSVRDFAADPRLDVERLERALR